MPWKETCALKERIEFILEAEGGDLTFADLCREYGISRKTGYKWLNRYDPGNIDSIADGRSLRVYPQSFDDETLLRVVDLRILKPTWGPLKLAAYLNDHDPDTLWPSSSTIKRLLKIEGLSRKRKPHGRLTHQSLKSGRLREITAPNEVWCADFKGWFHTGDGRKCEPLTVIDGHSRFLLVCRVVKDKRFQAMKEAFEIAFKEYGRPVAIRTDNGTPFGSNGPASLSPLAVWFIKEGVWPEKTRPGHPEDNSRQERFHKTLQEETASPPAKALGLQQLRFNQFRREYNNERPHEALGQKPPASIYVPGQYVLAPEYEYPEGMVKKYVSNKGLIYTRKKPVFISDSLAREWVGVIRLDEFRYRIEFRGYPVCIVKTEQPLDRYL